jgi:hypothetical protein
VGRSISRWIWMPSPGPMWLIWLKFDGADIILDRRSGFLHMARDKIIFMARTGSLTYYCTYHLVSKFRTFFLGKRITSKILNI